MLQEINNPLISIIVCCYNREQYLRKTMDSVLQQAYEPVEIIVMDDGSTDGTANLIRGYGNKVKYYRQENQGIAIARTNACKLAKGELIAFQDDDDLMHPERITSLYDALCRFPSAVFAVGDWAEIDVSGKKTGKRWLPENMLSENDAVIIQDGLKAVLWPEVPASPHTTLFWKKDGKKVGWFDKQFNNASEDKDFLARLAQLGPIAYIPKIVSYYRIGNSSLTKNKIQVAYSKILLYEKHLSLLTPDQKILRNHLERRILVAMKKIAIIENRYSLSEDSKKYILRGKSNISKFNWLDYLFYFKLKIPIKRFIRKNHKMHISL